jgi:hypothetical protein
MAKIVQQYVTALAIKTFKNQDSVGNEELYTAIFGNTEITA